MTLIDRSVPSVAVLAVSVLAVVISAATSSAVSAQDFAETDFAETAFAETIVTTANRMEQSLATTGSAVSVVTGVELEQRADKNLIGALNQLPGVYATETGGLGGTTNVRLRGADTDQTLVLVDGMRMNDPGSASGDFDFSSLLATDIERIEVVRGPQSTLWGSDAIGGVINIITRKGEDTPSGSLSAEAGSFDTYRLAGGMRGRSGNTLYSMTGSYLNTGGFSRLDENLGANERDGSEIFTLAGNTRTRVTERYHVELVGHVSRSDTETDPSLTSLAGDGEAASSRDVYSFQVNNIFSSTNQKFTNRLSAFVSSTQRTFVNPRLAYSDSEFDGNSFGIEYQGDASFDIGSITFGAKSQTDKADGAQSGTPGRQPQYDAQFDTNSVYAQFAFEPLAALNVTVGGRIDDFEIGGTESSYRVTVNRQFSDTGTSLRASYGTGVKAPTIYQAFYNGPDPVFGGVLLGNQNLDVETSSGFDVGFRQSLFADRLALDFSWFEQDIKNLIEYQNIIFGVTSSYVNIASVSIREGYEAAADYSVTEWLRLQASYTHLISRNDADNSDMPRTPREQASLGINLTPTNDLFIGVYVTYAGAQFNQSRSRQRLAPFSKTDVSVQYQLTDTVQLFARLDNVTDKQYQYIRNAGTADRSAYAGVRVSF